MLHRSIEDLITFELPANYRTGTRQKSYTPNKFSFNEAEWEILNTLATPLGVLSIELNMN